MHLIGWFASPRRRRYQFHNPSHHSGPQLLDYPSQTGKSPYQDFLRLQIQAPDESPQWVGHRELIRSWLHIAALISIGPN